MNQQNRAGHNSTTRLFLGLLVAVAFVVGGGYLWAAQSGPIDDYEPVEATVISSEVVSGTEGDSKPAITYEYTVGGRTYTSSNVLPGPGESSAGDAHQIVDNHPEGKQVTAYYNPENPSESFLVKKQDLFIPAMMIVLGGLVALVFGWTLVDRFRGP